MSVCASAFCTPAARASAVRVALRVGARLLLLCALFSCGLLVSRCEEKLPCTQVLVAFESDENIHASVVRVDVRIWGGEGCDPDEALELRREVSCPLDTAGELLPLRFLLDPVATSWRRRPTMQRMC